MATYSLMAGQTSVTGPYGPVPSPVVIAGAPTRGRVTFSLSGNSPAFAQASVWATTGANYVGYQQVVQLLSLNIANGAPNSISHEMRLPKPIVNLFAQLNAIDRSQAVAASVSLVV